MASELEEINAELAKRQSAPQGGDELAQINAELERRQGPKPKRLEPVELSTMDKALAKLPDVPQWYQNVATGMSGLYRGAANLASRPFQRPTMDQLVTGQKPKGLGDFMFPPASGSEGSVGRAVGEFLDPVSWAIGGGVAKAIPYANVLGGGIAQGAKAIAQNAAGGALAGGAIGALSDQGDMASGAATGALANTLVPPALSVATQAAGRVWDVLSGKYGQVKAGEILRKAAGGDLEAIKKATSAGAPGLSGVQTTAGIRNDVWNALKNIGEENDPSFYSNLAASQQAAREGQVAQIAGGAEQTAARARRGADKDLLNKATGPFRERSLTAANQAMTPISTYKITAGIDAKLNDPGIGTNPQTAKALSAVKAQIDDWTQRNGGVIDANALYGIRKNLNQTIEGLLPATGDPNALKAMAARISAQVRPMIDDAITNAGGNEWKTYLGMFERGMRNIDRKRMAGDALSMLQKYPQKLESLVAGNEPKAVEKVFGSGNYDIRKQMTPQQMGVLDKVSGELTRDRLINESAQRGKKALEGILSNEQSKFHLPNWINAKVAIANRGLKETEVRLNKQTADALVHGLRSGKSVNELLNTMPHAMRLRALNIIGQPGAAAITNVIQQEQ